MNSGTKLACCGLAALALIGLVVSSGCKPAKEQTAQRVETKLKEPDFQGAEAKLKAQDSQRVEAKLKELQSAGYPVTLAQLNQWAAVPGASAATLAKWTNALALLEGAFKASRAFPPSPTNENRVEMQRWLKVCRPALAAVAQASTNGPVQFATDFTFKNLDVPIGARKFVARAFQWEAFLHCQDRRPEWAVSSLGSMSAMATALEQEPVPLSQSIRLVILTGMQQTAQRILNTGLAHDQELSRLRQLFESVRCQEPMARSFAAERCNGLRVLRGAPEAFSELMTELRDFFGPNTSSTSLSRFFTNDIPSLSRRFEAHRDADCLAYLDALEQLCQGCSRSYREPFSVVSARQSRLQEDIARAERSDLVFSAMALQGYEKVLLRLDTTEARIRTAIVALAVEQYRLQHAGQLPARLEELPAELLKEVPADPFDGQPLRFKRLQRGFVVYSVGPHNNAEWDPARARVNPLAHDTWSSTSDYSEAVFWVTR